MEGTYDHWLVILSIAVAVVASYVALDLASRVTASAGRTARYWLLVWAMDSIPAGWLPLLVGVVAGGGMQRLLPAPPS